MANVRWYYSEDAATVLEITERVRLPVDPEGEAIGVGTHADAGSGWEGDLLVDDPSGDLILLMYRRIYAVQDEAPAGAQVMGNWFISSLAIERMDPWGPSSRRWIVTMADENSLLNRTKWTGADANRPAETDIARIRWALLETEMNTLSPDETYIDTTGPVTMPAADLRDSSPEDMMMSLFQASGKHYWIKYEEAAAVGGAIVSSSVAAATVVTTTTAHGLTTGQTVVIAGHSGSTPTINGTRVVTVTGATTFTIPVTVTVGGTGGTTTTVGRYVLWYADMNTSDLYRSTVSLSNDPADTIIDATNPTSLVYPLSDDAKLDRAGGRMAGKIIVPWTGGREYASNPAFVTAYAAVDRISSPPVPLTTAASAQAQATRELAELDVPDDEVSTVWTVQAARLNLIMRGMIVPVHATHFPGYTSNADDPGWATDFVDCRVMQKTINQLGPTTFDVPLRLSPMTPEPVVQYGTDNSNQALSWFTWPMGAPGAGLLLIGFEALRGTAASVDTTTVPRSYPDTNPSTPAVAGTAWTNITAFDVKTSDSTGPIAMAWRNSTADDTTYIRWDLSDGWARNHQVAIAGLSGAPLVTATSTNQTTAGTTYTSPPITVAAAGYIFAGFSFVTSGPHDRFGWGGFSMAAVAPAVIPGNVLQGWQNQNFGGFSVMCYRYVTGAGTYTLSLERTGEVAYPDDPDDPWGWIVGFWAGAVQSGYPAG